jgi:hypothetical protein
MAVAIAQIARELTMSRSELERRSLEAFIERERRLVNLDIADLQDRYGVRTARELASRIEIKAVYSPSGLGEDDRMGAFGSLPGTPHQLAG